MTTETGPIYGVELLDSLPLDGRTSMRQALPSRSDLQGVQNYRQGQRVVAGYEVLLEHYRRAIEVRDKLRAWVERTAKDSNLRKRSAGYHARRVCLEAGALLAELDGLYQTRPEPQKETP